MAKRKKKSAFKGKVAQNARKQQQEGRSYGHLKLPKGVDVFKPEGGNRYKFDILPYIVSDPKHPDRNDEYQVALPGMMWYRRPYKLHRNIGPSNDAVPCPASVGKKCPICEYRAKLLKDGADWGDDTVKSLKPSDRNAYAIRVIGSKKFEDGVYIWDVSQYLFQTKLNEEIDEDDTYEVFPDPDEGFTLKVRFSKENFGGNSFADTSRIDFIPREKPIKQEVLDAVPNLDELITIPTYKALEAMFFGGLDADEVEDIDAEDDDEYDEEEEVAEALVGSEDEDDEDEDDLDEDEDDDQDEDESEEDDDEEDDEEDEDPDEDEDEDAVPEGMTTCVACEGSGINSKGKTCRICKGKGYVPEPEDDEDEDEEEEEPEPPKTKAKAKAKTTPKTKAKPAAKEKSSGKKNKCPYGHKFGVDCEEYDECDDCELWEECIEAKDA